MDDIGTGGWVARLRSRHDRQRVGLVLSSTMRWKTCLFAALLAGGSLPLHAADKRPMTFDDLMAVRRVGEPVPSPDGKWVVYDAVDVNLDANTKRSHLWIVPAEGGESRPLNPGSENDESRPRI